MTAHDRTPAPPLDERELQAIERLMEAAEKVGGAYLLSAKVPALLAALRAAWRENARLDTENALLSDDNAWIRNEAARYRAALEHYADEATWKKASRYDTNKRVYVGWWGHPGYDHARAALAAAGAGGQATEERT